MTGESRRKDGRNWSALSIGVPVNQQAAICRLGVFAKVKFEMKQSLGKWGAMGACACGDHLLVQ
jgi:hypothetical protein